MAILGRYKYSYLPPFENKSKAFDLIWLKATDCKMNIPKTTPLIIVNKFKIYLCI